MTTEFKSWEELSELEQAQATYWDMHKDAYGVRPRGIDTTSWTLADFDAEFKLLGDLITRDDLIRKERQALAIEAFEARVQVLLGMGADDRAQALSWIHEAEETSGDDDYLCYTLGLPYQYFQ